MRKYTLEFKEEAVKLVTKGYTQAEAGKALGVSAKIISELFFVFIAIEFRCK